MLQKCNQAHRYRKRNIGSKVKPYFVFACLDCSHYARPELFIGRSARCINGCGSDIFTIKPKHKAMAKVKCDDCMRPKDTKGIDNTALDALVSGLIGGEKE